MADSEDDQPADMLDTHHRGSRASTASVPAVVRLKNRIDECTSSGFTTLDLRSLSLTEIPEQLLEDDGDFSTIEFLYLDNNRLTELSDRLFTCLPHLKWLDLRHNDLTDIPAVIGSHKCLRALLLEGNRLTSLPVQLGDVKTLTGLNLCNNPLTFPPAEVVALGTRAVLRFLSDCQPSTTLPLDHSAVVSHSQSGGRRFNLAISQGQTAPRLNLTEGLEELHLKDRLSSPSPSDSSADELLSSASLKMAVQKRRSSTGMAAAALRRNFKSDLDYLKPQSASLHQHVPYDEMRRNHMDKLKRAGALGILDKQAKRKKNADIPPLDPHYTRLADERRLAALRELKEKQALIEQRRRDQELLRQWRDDAKDLQRMKFRNQRGSENEYVDRTMKAPYGIDKDQIRMPNRTDVIKEEVKCRHEALKRMLTPRSKKKIEEARATQDQELEYRIKMHTLKMQERRTRDRLSAADEMKVTLKELNEAKQLQREIEIRRKATEYRFQAFTPDLS